MSDPIAPWIGREQTVEALGRNWRLARWELDVWNDLLAWAKPQIPDPLSLVKRHLADLPEALAKYTIDSAIVASRTFLSVDSPEVSSLLDSLEGSTKAMHLLLLPHQPQATQADAYRITFALGLREKRQEGKKSFVMRLFEKAMGKMPEGNADDPTPEK